MAILQVKRGNVNYKLIYAHHPQLTFPCRSICLFQEISHLFLLILVAILLQDAEAQQTHWRYRRGILGKWFGTESNAVVQPQRRYVNQQVPHYPIWKVHKYNGINLKPLPVSMVPNYHHPAQITETVRQVPIAGPKYFQEKPTNPLEPIVVVAPTITATSKTQEDIQGIMKLLGISDPSQVPSIQEVMDMLGATTQEEAIETVKEIAATEEGIDLIKSFIESRQSPEGDEIVEVAPTSTTTTTTTTTPAPVVIVREEKKLPGFHHFWSPKNAISTATARVASSLDQAHTNAHLLGNILPRTEAESTHSTFRNTLRNLKNFFTFQDNTAIPLDTFKERPLVPLKPRSTVVYVNEPIPASPINLPALPKLSPLPEFPPGIVGSVPSVPSMPHIQMPSHFSIPKSVVQGPYMKVNYPVSSLAPLPVFRQRPLYTYRGEQIGNAPAKTSYEVPLYGPPPALTTTTIHKSQIPISQSTKDAFKGAPKIISSFPVPSLPFEDDGEDDQFSAAANTPIEAVALPEADIAKADDEVSSATGAGPQRLSGYEAYATGKVHRATNVEIVQSRLTNSSAENLANDDDGER